MSLAFTILAYFIGIPIGIIFWKIALGGIEVNHNTKFTKSKQGETK